MEDPFNQLHNQVFTPYTLAELFVFWSRFPDAVLFAGGTDLLRRQTDRLLKLPKNIISLDKLDELKKINRTERYLEIGSAVCLSDILKLGKIVPEALISIINVIGNIRIRNLASIGGTIMSSHRYSDIHAMLIAQDALYELKSATNARWISASKFVASGRELLLEERALISRIRIPLTHWTYVFHKKIGHRDRDDPEGGTFLLLCNMDKTIITDLRIIFVGSVILRFKDIETNLLGQSLPLGDRPLETILNDCAPLIQDKIPNKRYLQNTLLRSLKVALSRII